MRNSNTILEIMLDDHALIEVLLIAFRDNLGKDIESIEESFDKFRWELEKHIFVEEKVIFKFCNLPESEICKTVNNLVKDHDNMLAMLNEVQNDLVTKNETDISKFQELLKTHRKIEEEVLYPRLDQILDKEQKEIIIARINEVPLKKEVDTI
jgi:iron-sulfur cluster repair protein YtfE (RIC family)